MTPDRINATASEIAGDSDIANGGYIWRVSRIAAIIAKHAGEEWQPISTAPKDGTPVLLARRWSTGIPGHEGTDIVLARWTCHQHAHLSRRHDCPNEGCDMGWDNYGGTATHWRPLPEPPSEAVQQHTDHPK